VLPNVIVQCCNCFGNWEILSQIVVPRSTVLTEILAWSQFLQADAR
jgi:hypothetical protein